MRMRSKIALQISRVLSWLNTSPQPHLHEGLWHELLSFLEQPLVTIPAGVIGGVLGILFPWVMYVCAGFLMLAVHHHVDFSRRARWKQISTFAILAPMLVIAVYRMNLAIQKKLQENNISFATLVASDVPAPKSSPPINLPTQIPSPPPHPRVVPKPLPGKEHTAVNPVTDADPDVKLLSDAERLCVALLGWHDAKIHQRVERENETKKENADRRLDEQVANAQIAWVDKTWWDETLPDYQQTFAPELLRTRRLMLALAPEAAGHTRDWENPGNSGDITGIQFDFASLVNAYRIHLQKMGRVTPTLTPDEQHMDIEELRFIFSR
jgi:hypothetical protein